MQAVGRLLTRPVFIIPAAFVFVMAFQGSRGIWEPDEGRYTAIAEQMLRSGDFLHPAFNDDMPHYAKPPLVYWAVAGGIELLGRNEWAARLANALAFTGTVALLYALARRILPARPWLPPLIYGSFFFTQAAANIVSPDTILTLWETLAVFGFVRYWTTRDQCRARNLLIMWLGFGLAFLTKGPPGLLPLIAIAAFVAFVEGWRSVARLMTVPGLLVVAILGFGWYIVVAATTPGLTTYFLRDEFARRITSGAFHRNPQWYGGFAVYIPTLFLGLLPWTFFLLRGITSLRRTLFARDWWRSGRQGDQWAIFLTFWLVIPLVIFWITRSRLPLYVLPLFPAFALVVARQLANWRPRPFVTVLLGIWMLMLLGLKLGLAHYPYEHDSRPLARAIAADVEPVPDEVLFVEAPPVWGLGIYLGCEVDQARVEPPANSSEISLAAELAQHEWRVLVVAKANHRASIAAQVERLGYETKDLGGTDKWAFIGPTSELRRR